MNRTRSLISDRPRDMGGGDVVMRALSRCLFVGALLVPAAALAWAPDWSDPSWPLQALGRQCADVDVSLGAQASLLCTAGVVAGVRLPVDMLHVTLPGERVVAERAATGVRRPSLRITASATRLMIRNVTCGACARVMGTGWLIDLAMIAAPDLAAIQTDLGLPAAPLLRDPASWASVTRAPAESTIAR